jgi:alkylation response protein AidB-like acyl-CoA dehydrogenase
VATAAELGIAQIGVPEEVGGLSAQRTAVSNVLVAEAKAGRSATEIALRCVALACSAGYGEGELLEKWARDAKILDIFEGTQQIQLLIVARRLLGKTSQELR